MPTTAVDTTTATGTTSSPLAQVHRQLDLDDFANSPAADADDSEDPDLDGKEGHDFEMRVALG